MPRTRIEFVEGQRFGRLTAISDEGVKNKIRSWTVSCDCGTVKVVAVSNLMHGRVRSCGCYKKQFPNRLVHGHKRIGGRSPAYSSWVAMKHRCENPKSRKFPMYGGRGIAICERWSDFSFFLEDMGPRPPDTTLDRINNNGNYEPSNCRWANAFQQARNTRRNKIFTFSGQTKCLAEWAEHFGIDPQVVNTRIRRGWDPLTAFMKLSRAAARTD